MPGRRVFIVAALVILLGLVGADGALACSCARATPAESFARADAAVVGRLLGVTPRGPDRAAYRYRVLRVYRGAGEIAGGSVLTVLSGRGPAACALPTRSGRNYGLFLLGDGGRWAGGLCGVVAPRRLWLAARHAAAGAARAAPALVSCAS